MRYLLALAILAACASPLAPPEPGVCTAAMDSVLVARGEPDLTYRMTMRDRETQIVVWFTDAWNYDSTQVSFLSEGNDCTVSELTMSF